MATYNEDKNWSDNPLVFSSDNGGSAALNDAVVNTDSYSGDITINASSSDPRIQHYPSSNLPYAGLISFVGELTVSNW